MQFVVQIPYRDRAGYMRGCFENPSNALTNMYAAPPPQHQDQTEMTLLSPEEAEQEAWLKTIKSLPEGGWEFVAFSADSESMLFASTYDLSRDGSMASLWYRWEFMNGQHNQEASDQFYSVMEWDEVDCAGLARKQLAIAYYAGNNLDREGSSYVRDVTKLLWSSAIPGTVGELMTTWACIRVSLFPQSPAPEERPK